MHDTLYRQREVYAMSSTTIHTIGHSYHSADMLCSLLKTNGVTMLVDVRSMPGSRKSPWFNRENMIEWLPANGVMYRHVPALGGRRYTPVGDRTRVNAGWRVESFRWFANYTLTEEYNIGLQYLTLLAHRFSVAIMCGEPSPTRCHRQIIANSLVAQGHTVQHVQPDGSTIQHRLGLYGAAPHIDRSGVITYPADERILEEA